MSIAVLWVINFGISILNALSVGAVWTETKSIGGMTRFLAWCGAIMSACGFIWCYAVIEAIVLYELEYFSAENVDVVMSMVYILIYFPVVGSGIGILIDSWVEFARRRTLGSAVRAGWNTYAQTRNMYDGIRALPQAYRTVGDFYSGDSGSSRR